MKVEGGFIVTMYIVQVVFHAQNLAVLHSCGVLIKYGNHSKFLLYVVVQNMY